MDKFPNKLMVIKLNLILLVFYLCKRCKTKENIEVKIVDGIVILYFGIELQI